MLEQGGRSLQPDLSLNAIHGILDRQDFLRLVHRDFNIEDFLERHDEFDYCQRIRLEVLDKIGCWDYGFRIHFQLLHNDLFYARCNFQCGHRIPTPSAKVI